MYDFYQSGETFSNAPTASQQRGKTFLNEYPGYDTKQSDGERFVLKLWVMWSTPSLPLLPSPLWSGVVAPDRVLSMCQKELFDIQTVYKQMTYAELNC